jgi:hypothetical protein
MRISLPLVAGHDAPARARLPQLVFGSQDRVDGGLRRSVELVEAGVREEVHHPALDLDGERRGADDETLHGVELVGGDHLLGQGGQSVEDRRDHEGGRDALLLDEAQGLLRIEAPLDHDAPPHQVRDPREHGGRGVVERTDDEMAIRGRVAEALDHPHHELAGRRVALVGGLAIGTLRPTGRPRGVDDRAGALPGGGERLGGASLDRVVEEGGLGEGGSALGLGSDEHEALLRDPGHLALRALEARREARVADDRLRVRVVHDVGSLVPREPEADRHYSRRFVSIQATRSPGPMP